MASKLINLFSHPMGANGWKIAILCSELGLKTEVEYVDFSVMHTPVYEKWNPNGRVPTIVDNNTGVKIWESGAIIKYLIETYDTNHRLSFSTSPEKFLTDCDEHMDRASTRYLRWQPPSNHPLT